MSLRIRLLGGVSIDQDGSPVRLESGRVESLLGYLLLHRDTPQSRQHLAFQLWPDTTDAQARTNLRHLLHSLRRAWPDVDAHLDVGNRTVQWRSAAAVDLDVEMFDAALDAAQDSAGDRIGSLGAAVDLYRGELLPGCFDEWLPAERDRHRLRYLAALRELVTLHEAKHDVAKAISYAERLLVTDPLDEPTYRMLMRLHDARGDRALAVRSYHRCASTLERELGVEPSAQTRLAYDTLLSAEPATAPVGSARRTAHGSVFVGRIPERRQLIASWRNAEARRPALVAVSGETGIGKTRLVEEFRAWCGQHGAACASARSYAAEGDLPYGPIAAWLRSPVIRPALLQLDHDRLTDIARLLPQLLTDIPGLPRPEPVPDPDRRQRLWDAIAGALLSVRRPLLLVADDLQWADKESLQFLHYLLRRNAPLLVVATVRTGDVDPDSAVAELFRAAGLLERFVELHLGPLPADDVAALAERLGGAALTGAAAEQLYRETEGNPLFVVEAIRAGRTEPGLVTAKVQAVIESRLAQLSPPARDLVAVAATIGRDFSMDLLSAAAGTDENTLVAALDELWRRRIVRDQGNLLYDFSHDKIRAVAYAAVGPVRRRHLHRRIGRALEQVIGGEGASAAIAAHYEHAGATDAAAQWYARAGLAAQLLHANADAVRLLERSRDLLRTLPPSADRDGRELAVLTALPAALVSVEGYASPRLAAAHQRAVRLAGGSTVELAPPLLWSLAFASLVLDDFTGAERFAAELTGRGDRDGDDVLVVEGSCLLGLAAFWQADLPTARVHLEQTVDRYRPAQCTAHLAAYGQDPAVVALARLGNTLWFLGDPAGACRARAAALSRAEEIGHPLTSAAALIFAALLAIDMDDEPSMIRYVRELTAIDHPAAPIRHTLTALTGYLEVLDHRTEAGRTMIRQAVDDANINPAAPGMPAILERIMLAACVSTADADAVVASAQRLLGLVSGLVWAPEARRRLHFATDG